jgi:hypothetical protein
MWFLLPSLGAPGAPSFLVNEILIVVIGRLPKYECIMERSTIAASEAFTETRGMSVSGRFLWYKLPELNGNLCGKHDIQMQPGNGNFSRRSDIPK